MKTADKLAEEINNIYSNSIMGADWKAKKIINKYTRDIKANQRREIADFISKLTISDITKAGTLRDAILKGE